MHLYEFVSVWEYGLCMLMLSYTVYLFIGLG